MSNTQHALGKGPVVPAGDMGIGLCLQCLGDVMARGEQAPPPRFAVTFAPMVHNQPTPVGVVTGMVAVPACWEHLSGTGSDQQAEQRRPLLVANGSFR